mgnify:CR=1 FL=1
MAKSVLQELVVKLSGDTSQLVSSVGDASSIVDKLGKVGGFAVASIGVGVASAVTAISGITVKAVKSASDAENIQAQLNAVLKSTGGAAGVTTDKVNALASSLSTLTPFEDDAIVSGQNMLLTFTNIGASNGIFDQTTGIMLDMSQAMGTDLTSSAMQLGKALNDPTNGISALTRVGVTFSDSQKEMIKKLQETGNMAGAQQVILDELKKEFGGSAEAAGKTFAGSLEIAKNSVGNILEAIGSKLLPVLTDAANKFTAWINTAEAQAMIQDLSNAVSTFANGVITYIPVVFSAFSNIFTFLMNNKPVIIGIFLALGVVIGVWAVQTAAAGVAAMIPFLPVIGIILGIIAIGALLVTAWNSDFLGIRTTITEVVGDIVIIWNSVLKPAIGSVATWFSDTIAKVKGFITNFGQIGKDIVNGVWSGIQSKATEFKNNVMNFFKSIVDSVKNALGIHSPSTVFAGIGKNMALGLKQGFTVNLEKIPELTGQTIVQANYGSLTPYSNPSADIVNAVNGNAIDYEKLARTLRVELSKYFG